MKRPIHKRGGPASAGVSRRCQAAPQDLLGDGDAWTGGTITREQYRRRYGEGRPS